MRSLTFVIGCGRLGGAIANYSSAQGDSVIVIDPNPNCSDNLTEVFSGNLLHFDASDVEGLKEAGIENAKEVIITSGDDNLNLFLAHLCSKIFGVPYVYVRFDDPDKGLLCQGASIKAIYPFQLSKDRLNLLRAGVAEGGRE
ncbi:MAG: TrkA family potassium uptake protein [Bacilli bacterium]|nr:TrkA family potassium uptake protein [Bacilli bacterium]MBQ4255425.1 TrkA family potassium uptake protein [Bacilli bacterium]